MATSTSTSPSLARRRLGTSAALPLQAIAPVVLALLLAIPLARHLGISPSDYDDGAYIAEARALAGGAHLGTQIFSAQPPLFYALLHLADVLVGGSAAGIRAIWVAITLGGCLAGYALVRELATPWAGLVAMPLVALMCSRGAAVVQADIVSVMFGVAALAAAGAAARRPWLGLLAGVLVAVAVLIKLLAVPFLIGVAVTIWARRLPLRTFVLMVAGAIVVAIATFAPYLDVLGTLKQQVVGFHLKPSHMIAFGFSDVGPNLLGLLVALGAGLAFARPRDWPEWLRLRAPLIATMLGGLLLLSQLRPLFLHHVVIVSVPLALLAASAWPRPRPLALVALGAALVVFGLYVERRPLSPPAQRARLARVAQIVRAGTPLHGKVATDLPDLYLIVGRPGVPQVLDPSYTRVKQGGLTESLLRDVVRRSDAVVIGRAFQGAPERGIRDLLARFSRRARVHDIKIWLR